MQKKSVLFSGFIVFLLLIFSVLYQFNRASENMSSPTNNTAMEGLSSEVCLDWDKAKKRCVRQGQMGVSLHPHPVVVEQEIAVKLSFDEAWAFENAWVEGVNMYMGKSPLIVRSQINGGSEIEAIMFLGSCSEPNMQWQITAQWKEKNPDLNSKTQRNVIATYDIFTSR